MPECGTRGKSAVPDRIWDGNADLRAAAEAERERHRDAQLEIADARLPEFSDEALALRFAAKHADNPRYVADRGKWLLWTGSHWRLDTTMQAFDMARNICRVASAEVPPDKIKLAAAIASAKTVAAVIGLARADRRLAATVEQWDADPWLLNTSGGIVDLRTAETLPHDPGCHMTNHGRRARRRLSAVAKIPRGDHQ